MAKLPFMKFYPADFLIDTQRLTMMERGIWVTLLSHIWIHSKDGSIELDEKELGGLIGHRVEDMEAFIHLMKTGVGDIEEISEPKTKSQVFIIHSRRIERDKKRLKDNALRVSNHRSNARSNKNVMDKKSEAKKLIKDKDNNKDSPAAPVRSSELSIVGETKKAPHVDFVERFKASYQTITGQPFKDDRHHYIIAAALIKKHGVEQCVLKVKMLGSMCKNRSAWFTKEGWADFSLEKLSSQWNAIIPSHTQSQEEKELETWKEESRKARELSERTNATIKRG